MDLGCWLLHIPTLLKRKTSWEKDKNWSETRGKTEKAQNCRGFIIFVMSYFHPCLVNTLVTSSAFSLLSEQHLALPSLRKTHKEEMRKKLFHTFLYSSQFQVMVQPWGTVCRTLIPNIAHTANLPAGIQVSTFHFNPQRSHLWYNQHRVAEALKSLGKRVTL